MNTKIIIDTKMCCKINISELKDIKTTPEVDEVVQPKDIEKIKTIFNIIADDLLNLYQTDYTTTLILTITSASIEINLTKGYPFHYKYSNMDGIIRNVYHRFNYDACTSEKAIINLLNDSINRIYKDHESISKNYSSIRDKQGFYLNLKKIDNLLFGENKLVKKFSYIDSIYACNRHDAYKFGHIEVSLQAEKEQCILYINFGKLMLSVSKNGVIIRKKTGLTKYEMIHHYDTYRLNVDELETAFVSYYNLVYEKDYTKISDIVIIEDMMAI